ncbi:MAG TPA: methylated-DNA--[protein]-cysteine S-methyltransferase [Myxococcales bacterium]|jgi:methylated-DNA-[protein]-cysteine S-methyltransferase|nr:methylated-DNA--[protein]-cysteine S-methyltransferase [Myxococcales bacterium]
MLRIDTVETPIGPVHLALEGDALCALRFDAPFEGVPERTPVSDRVRAYFAGDVRALDEIAVEPAGTPFQRRVWKALREIPPGETRTYGDLARQLGTHPRAVGSANGANPVCLAIPCHRVIGADGKLCGYAWGEDRKRWLLDHERR